LSRMLSTVQVLVNATSRCSALRRNVSKGEERAERP
jgi:hypothetical protein